MRYTHYSSRPEDPQVPPRAINEFAGGTGPAGVYAYQEGAGTVTFAATRPYVFTIIPTVPVLYTAKYTDAQLETDLHRLAAQVDISRPLRMWGRLISDYEARNAFWPFAKLWYVVTHLTRSSDPDDLPSRSQASCADPTFTRELLVSLGYVVIDDRNGMMYSSEPEQAVFLTDDSFKVVERVKNPKVRNPASNYVPNPAWATDLIARAYTTLEETVPSEWLPRLKDMTASGPQSVSATLNEYGCGVYGCVYPTLSKDVVMKVTRDDTEADFALRYANALGRPICVSYHMVLKLSEQHEGHDVHLLWRDSATKVGEVQRVLGDRAVELIDVQHLAAQHAYRGMLDGVSMEQTRRDVAAWLTTCEAMARQTEVVQLREFGDGLVEIFADQRIFFGDIHTGNLGIVMKAGRSHWVITDPGNIAVIEDY